MFERFTDGGRRSVVLAGEAARDLGHGSITVVHLFLGASAVMRETGEDALGPVTPEQLRRSVAELQPAGSADRPEEGHIPFTAGAKKTLELSLREALDRGDNDIKPRHVLLAALDNPDDGLDAVLTAVGLSAESLRADLAPGLPPLTGPRGPAFSQTRQRLDRIEGMLIELKAQLDRIERRLDSS